LAEKNEKNPICLNRSFAQHMIRESSDGFLAASDVLVEAGVFGNRDNANRALSRWHAWSLSLFVSRTFPCAAGVLCVHRGDADAFIEFILRHRHRGQAEAIRAGIANQMRRSSSLERVWSMAFPAVIDEAYEQECAAVLADFVDPSDAPEMHARHAAKGPPPKRQRHQDWDAYLDALERYYS
jgi:hypothetical protein